MHIIILVFYKIKLRGPQILFTAATTKISKYWILRLCSGQCCRIFELLKSFIGRFASWIGVRVVTQSSSVHFLSHETVQVHVCQRLHLSMSQFICDMSGCSFESYNDICFGGENPGLLLGRWTLSRVQKWAFRFVWTHLPSLLSLESESIDLLIHAIIPLHHSQCKRSSDDDEISRQVYFGR